MKLTELANKKILIVGYGKEGKSTYEFLKTRMTGAAIDVADQKDGPAYLDNQEKYDIAIRSPGIHKKFIRIPYTTATNIFFANAKGMTIAVTGTKGKSTTSSLIYAILNRAGLRAHLVGNIGNPMLGELLFEKGKEDIYVCELSSYQLDDITYSPHIAVMINFFPEHMDYHGSVEEYWNSKKRIVQFSTNEDYFVYNSRFAMLRDLAKETHAKTIPYVNSIPFPSKDIPLLGEHNKENIRAALTVGEILTISPTDAHEAIAAFKPLPHRLQNVGTYGGITFYDDAISTTPESTICAIEAIDNISTIFLGGQDRGYTFDSLAEALHRKKIQNIVLFPDSGTAIARSMKKYAQDNLLLLQTLDMKEAVAFAYKHAPKGTVCLLSTASPSYSVWKNFEEKGELFQTCVKELGASIK